jgi:hypothetical protein
MDSSIKINNAVDSLTARDLGAWRSIVAPSLSFSAPTQHMMFLIKIWVKVLGLYAGIWARKVLILLLRRIRNSDSAY